MKLTLIQLKNLQNNDANLNHAVEMIDKAAAAGTDFIVLPEMFSCPYKTSKFPLYAQEEGGSNWKLLSDVAKRNGVYLAAGSMPELEVSRDCCEHVEKIYNTSYVFDRNGNQITTFDTEFGKFGLMICFDIRFPEMARCMESEGARLIIVPAAFNMTSGPRWWELMFRSRAVDNQLFMCGCSPARDEKASYIAWGHSIAVDPWGEILGQLDIEEDMLTVEIDFEKINQVRQQVPLISAKRTDLYQVIIQYPV